MSGPDLLQQISPRRPVLPAVALVLLALASCAPLPLTTRDLPASPAEPPTLLPLEDILAQARTSTMAADPGAGLSARAARLRARAALMQGPVHDPATRARLAEAIRGGRA